MYVKYTYIVGYPILVVYLPLKAVVVAHKIDFLAVVTYKMSADTHIKLLHVRLLKTAFQ